jgi:hypothetical protein
MTLAFVITTDLPDQRLEDLWPRADIICPNHLSVGLCEALTAEPDFVVSVERPVSIDELHALIGFRVDVAVIGSRLAPRAVCWRSDVLAAAMAEPISFAVTPRLLRRAVRGGASVVHLQPADLDNFTYEPAARRISAHSWNSHSRVA